MLTDPFLEAWTDAVDATTAHLPELAPWLADRDAVFDASHWLDEFRYDPGERLIRQGATEREALFVVRGHVEVVQRLVDGFESSIRRADAPISLGATAFSTGLPRADSVRALSAGLGLSLSRGSLSAIARRNPEVGIGLLRWLALDQSAWLRDTRCRRDVWSLEHGMAGVTRTFATPPTDRFELQGRAAVVAAGYLPTIRCLQGASPGSLAPWIGEVVRLVGVPRGGCVTSHGAHDRSLMLLLHGGATVRTVDDEVLARFKGHARSPAGALIGELGFLCGTPRDGTVIAETDCVLLEIPHQSSQALVAIDAYLAFRIHLAVLQTLGCRLREQDADRARTASVLADDFDSWTAS